MSIKFLADGHEGTQVNFKLRELAEEMGPEVGKFKQLANSVEEFTYCLLDPLKSRKPPDDRFCEQFGDYSLDGILDDAIEFEQKKFFTHPAVHHEMKRKWHGRNFMKTPWKSWQLKLFIFWCIFDLVFSPFLLAASSLIKNKRKVADKYLAFLESPYFKFVRDTLSHLVLLALLYALCLSPSTIAFSGLEWIILVFFVGRYLVELKQIYCVKQRLKRTQETGADGAKSSYWKIFSMYLSDYWNKLDFMTLAVYFTIFILRVVTWANGGSIANNRTLIVAGYLYSFNTLCLTLRAFGHVMEQSETFGITQIALFSILNDVRTVFWQFIAAMLAFSVAITKVYVSEKSFIADGSEKHEIACKSSGISCWWSIFTHLGWSLLGESEDVDPLTSVDLPSVTLGRILFAAFLIMGVILLINMLIALLSNTYQRTEDNAIMEWSFKRAITVQTYGDYDPIPVPLNIIYRVFIMLRRLVRGKEVTEAPFSKLEEHVKDFEKDYFAEYGNIFPVTEEKRLDFVLKETERNRQMVSQILSATFTSQGKDTGVLCSGQKAWEFDKGIRIEGPLLTFDCADQSCPKEKHYHGVRYRTCFSPEFPHFEVTIIESGKTGWLGIGIVHEDYDVDEMPGFEDGSVGYHTDDGKIFQNDYDPDTETEGPVMARRGDRVRCTVLFEGMQEGSGKVPVFFTLNGKKIIIRGGDIFMDYDGSGPLFPHIGLTDGSSVLVKMCAREGGNGHCSQSQELNSDLADTKDDGVCHDLEIQKEKSGDDLGSRNDPINQNLETQENMEAVISREVKKATRSLEEKLDALLTRLSEMK